MYYDSFVLNYKIMSKSIALEKADKETDVNTHRNHLLLIAINEYQNYNPLHNCRRDAENFKNILFEKYRFSDEHTRELLDTDATGENILNALKNYTTLKEQDNLIILFSGHGHLDPESEKGYWVPVDADKGRMMSLIDNVVVLDYLKKINCRHIVLFSDCCFSHSLLIQDNTKNINSLYSDNSRWAITAGKYQVLDNSKFVDTIVSFLQEAREDVFLTSLAHELKSKFAADEFQTPQCSPLFDKNHHGGEFIFYLEDMEADNEPFKGLNNIAEVIHRYRPSSQLVEVSKPDTGGDNLRIGYSLFQEVDPVYKRASNFLYLYQGARLRATYDFIMKHHGESAKLKERDLVILLPKEKRQSTRKRLENVKRIFKLHTDTVFYIDEFIRTKCTDEQFQRNSDTVDRYLVIDNFVLPKIKDSEGHFTKPEMLEEWFERDDQPVIVFRGSGGIGKTTFTQYLADRFLKIYPKNRRYFIQSEKVISDLLYITNANNRRNVTLYDFYESWFNQNEETGYKLDRESFRLNFDAGNFLMVLDGLDEVISRLSNFLFRDFLRSIRDFSSSIGNGKVLITCRSFFWDLQEEYDEEFIQTFEILPFNDEQRLTFFTESFKKHQKLIARALELSQEFSFTIPDDRHKYHHPYVLDLVRHIVEDKNIALEDSTVQSEILDQKLQTDYIIYKVFYREEIRMKEIRTKEISVDDQVKIFMDMAVKYHGSTDFSHFEQILRNILGKGGLIDKTIVQTFKSHSFLHTTKNHLQFKYDFLHGYFRAMYVSHALLAKNEEIGPEKLKILKDLLADNCRLNSAVVLDIVNRVRKWDDEVILNIGQLTGEITRMLKEESSRRPNDKNDTRKAISALFYIILNLYQRFNDHSMAVNTEAMKFIFGKHDNIIEGLCLINLSDESSKIKFDFSDLQFHNCYFDAVDSFWDFKLNSNTRFFNCSLLNIKTKSDVPTDITRRDYFIDCVTDTMFEDQFKHIGNRKMNDKKAVTEYLTKFFNLFYSKGRLERQGLDFTIKRRYPGITPRVMEFDDLLKLMLEEDAVIKFKDHNEDKLAISDEFKNDVVKFCQNGLVTNKMNRIIQAIMSNAK